MFATLSRFRRHVAVLGVLALMASVLAAAPAAADEHPEPDYKAAFDACLDAPSSDFEDVPEMHTSAGSIDCIAYYGITKGTSATTYSPLMSVTREHMALFLTRLAGLVDIEMASDPDDAGFTDIGDLSEGSQTAINQLADLEITRGTSATTYSPEASVTRGQMALFIARLMNLMDPLSDGDDSDGDYGYTPSDVADNDQEKRIGTPFTDLGPVTKTAYDAITQLYELGVAAGISETAYGPSALITRAHMADFMAGVLAHSSLRPSGVSIQSSKTTGYGEITNAVVMISVRDDSFAPMGDQAVDYFNSEAANKGLKRGKCVDTDVTGDCEWTENDELTNAAGNIILTAQGATEGETNVIYAWIGEESGDEFDATKVDYDSVSITSMKDEEALKATSTINKEATNNQVDLDKVKSVTITVQLVDTADTTATPAGADEDAKAVARSGQTITVGLSQSPDADANGTADVDGGGDAVVSFNSSRVDSLVTDDDGKVTYTIDAPKDDDDKNDVQIGDDVNGTPATAASNLEGRIDTVTFTYVDDEDVNDGTPEVGVVMFVIRWSEANPRTIKAEAETNAYVVRESDGDAKVSASVIFYDQYGNGYRQASGQQVGIEFGEESDAQGTAIDPVTNVRSNGVGRRGTTVENSTTGTPITVTYRPNPTETPTDIDVSAISTVTGSTSIQVVTEADQDDTGSKAVHTLYKDDNEFTTEVSDADTDADKLYSYDSEDIYIMGGEVITMDKFEELLANRVNASDEHVNAAVVNVVRYNPGGESIFEVTADSDPDN